MANLYLQEFILQNNLIKNIGSSTPITKERHFSKLKPLCNEWIEVLNRLKKENINYYNDILEKKKELYSYCLKILASF